MESSNSNNNNNPSGPSSSSSGEGGKYKGLTGKDIQYLTVEEQKKYVLKDADLVMKLSKYNNGEVLDAMKSISEITGLDFERVCRTGISTWWAAIFDDMTTNGERDSLLAASRSYGMKQREEKNGGQDYVYYGIIIILVSESFPF
jgi:hypothetical protein